MSDGAMYSHSGRWDSITDVGDSSLPSFNPINWAQLQGKDPAVDFDQRSLSQFNDVSFGEDAPSTVQPGAVFGKNPHDVFASDPSFYQNQLFTDFSSANQRFGQLTPPDDLSPKSADAKEQTAQSVQSDMPMADEEEEQKVDLKRRKSSRSKDCMPRKRGRKSTVKLETEDLPPEEAAKREQFLERNRVAAHKCRQKKKEWMVNLDEKCRDLQAHNKVLSAAVGELNEEVFRLKNILFQHTDCQFPPIQTYISQAAERMRSQAAALAPPPSAEPPNPLANHHAYPNHSARSSVHSRFGSMGFDAASNDVAGSVGRASTSVRSASCSTADVGDEAWTSMLTTS